MPFSLLLPGGVGEVGRFRCAITRVADHSILELVELFRAHIFQHGKFLESRFADRFEDRLVNTLRRGVGVLQLAQIPFGAVAGARPTGIVTRPKLRDPFQVVRIGAAFAVDKCSGTGQIRRDAALPFPA